ncbi:PTS glucose transporter subunit IIA, partial [Bacillus pumilus]|uniref:PTS glucose transporter subunit IIA n=1 Tax=Bacillus pumilus TaxID=1408 RepID=UPI0034D98101
MTLLLPFKHLPLKHHTKPHKPQQNKHTLTLQNQLLQTPLRPQLNPLNQLNHPTFSNQIIHKPTPILPTLPPLLPPFNRNLQTIFQTKHPIPLNTHQATQLLIHLPIHTLNLRRKHFTT